MPYNSKKKAAEEPRPGMIEKRVKSEFKYEIDAAFGDSILDERANSCTILRKISWNGKPSVLDIRKYTYKDKDEVMLKGIGLSEDAGDELACVLVEKDYGGTRRILRALKKRDDFDESLLSPDADLSDDTDGNDTEYFDPKQLLGLAGDNSKTNSSDTDSNSSEDDSEEDEEG